MIDEKKQRELDFLYAVSERTHPLPNKEVVFYDRFKEPLPLSNPKVTYRKYRFRLLKQNNQESQKQYTKKMIGK